jgi:sulfur-carrier protein
VKIKILFFGIVRDIVGENAIELELNKDISVSIFQQILKEKYPGLTDIKNYAVAVNEEYVSGTYSIQQNDVIAIIPPVSGG